MVALNALDTIAIVLYFVLVIGVSVYAAYSSKRGSVNGYFLAGRFMTFIPVGASVFASNIGSEHFIGLVGSGAASGLGVGAFELDATILLQLLAHLFIPIYLASKVTTLPEYMEKRFGNKKWIKLYLTILSLVLYIFTKISVNLYSGALFIERALSWSLYTSVLFILLLTAATTITGGLTAVIYTDTLQTVIMLTGASIVAAKSMIQIGGWNGLQQKYMEAIPNVTYPGTTCGYPRSDAFNILRDPVDGDIPWPGFIFGQLPTSTWYWCADQIMVQRVLAAKSLSHAQGALVLAGYLKLLPLFLMVVPGMVARALYPDTIGCATEEACMAFCNNKVSCSNFAYPELVLNILPTGMRGIMIAVMLAALMSDLTSIFNSASTLFTMDVWPLFRKNPGTREKLLVGRCFVLVLTVISILWIPLIEVLQGGQLFIYIQSISAYLAPPIAAVYLMAVLSTRVNEKGAIWGLCAGSVVGIARMILEFSYPQPRCDQEDGRPFVVTLHYMYFAIVVFWITAITAIVISLLTGPEDEASLQNTTIWTRTYAENESENTVEDIVLNARPKVIQSEGLANNESGSEEPVYLKAYNWVCGFNNIEEKEEQLTTMNTNMAKQSKKMKIIIGFCSASIITSGITMYTVFSCGVNL